MKKAWLDGGVTTTLLALGLFCTMASTSRAAEATAKLTVADFSQMTEEDRWDALRAGLASRDAGLARFTYVLSEAIWSVGSQQQQQKLVRRSEMTLARDGVQSAFHCKRLGDSDKVVSEFITVWDGRQQRSLTKLAGDKESSGLVDDVESEFVQGVAFNELFGYRMVEAPFTMTAWLDGGTSPARGAERWRHSVSIDEKASAVVLRIEQSKEYAFEFWVDPARDFMTVRTKYSADYGDSRGSATAWVTKAEQRDGIWLPTAVTRINELSDAKGASTRREYDPLVLQQREDCGEGVLGRVSPGNAGARQGPAGGVRRVRRWQGVPPPIF